MIHRPNEGEFLAVAGVQYIKEAAVKHLSKSARQQGPVNIHNSQADDTAGFLRGAPPKSNSVATLAVNNGWGG